MALQYFSALMEEPDELARDGTDGILGPAYAITNITMIFT